MALRKPQFLLKPSLFVLVLLLLISSIMLALSTGGFIVNFKTVGFSALSALQKGTRAVYSSVTGVVSAVQEIRVLREEYQRLTQRLENYEYMQQSNAEIRRENERGSSWILLPSLSIKVILLRLLGGIQTINIPLSPSTREATRVSKRICR